jgi:hypothetical protein
MGDRHLKSYQSNSVEKASKEEQSWTTLGVQSNCPTSMLMRHDILRRPLERPFAFDGLIKARIVYSRR